MEYHHVVWQFLHQLREPGSIAPVNLPHDPDQLLRLLLSVAQLDPAELIQ
jgi:hypothetical protein